MDYFAIEGVAGKYFTCQQFRATLSVASCSGRWKDAQSGKCFDTCKNCAIGATHSGKQVVAKPAQTMCARCGEFVTRLVTGGICLGCYNRYRETVKGRNGKGQPPRPVDVFWGDFSTTKVVTLHDVTLRASSCDSTVLLQHRTASFLEAIVRSLRTFSDPPVFYRRPRRREVRQISFLF